jgi:hypothetical protein
MCVMSVVMDKFNPVFPSPNQWPSRPFPAAQPWLPDVKTGPPDPAIEIEQMRKHIEAFREAVKAAEVIDRVTEQPDCVDPEKEKLVERVAELEAKINKYERDALPERDRPVHIRSTLTMVYEDTPAAWDYETADELLCSIREEGPGGLYEAIEMDQEFTFTVEVVEES